ncbi:MAG: DUF4349 domain-containing protein [Pseudomonadota bacterium]
MKKIAVLSCALAIAACSSKEAHHMGAPKLAEVRMNMVQPSAPGFSPGADAAAPSPASPVRFIATTHRLILEAPGAELQQRFAAIQAECLRLGCIVLSANQIQETPSRRAEATLSARVPPKAFDAFLNGALSRSKLLEHHQDSEDKTDEVIDVEARIKNLTALRARVLDLLVKHAGTLKDTLEAEKQLSETQSELDSIQGRRKALANQTEMVKVHITLSAQSFRAEDSWFAPLADAASQSGRVLVSSLAMLLTLTVAALPWLVALTACVMLIRRTLRRRKASQA